MYLPLVKAHAECGHLPEAGMHCNPESTFPEQQMQRRHASSQCVYVSVKHNDYTQVYTCSAAWPP